MSKHDFSPEEFAGRLRQVRAAMAVAGLDWLVAIHPVSIHWLTGSDAKSYQEFQCLLIGGTDQPLVVLTRAGEVHEFATDSLADEVIGWGGGETEDPVAAFTDLARRFGLMKARVGLEVPAYYLHPHHYLGVRAALGNALVSEPTDLIADLRLVKSPAELGYVRRASAIADTALGTFAAALAPGRTELELAGGVYQALLANGSGIAASPINLVSGERTAYSHGGPTARRLRYGDDVNIEFGATFNRYTATIGRQYCLGAPTSRMRDLYGIAHAASDAMIAAIRDGVAASAVHEAARSIIKDAGLDRWRVHLSGYALAPGFPPSWGEPLHFAAGSRHVLRAGMVVTVEPPIFIGPEGVGVRIIDNVIVTAIGAQLLSTASRDLVVIP
jgi:Xaa-Pro dipeptidase